MSFLVLGTETICPCVFHTDDHDRQIKLTETTMTIKVMKVRSGAFLAAAAAVLSVGSAWAVDVNVALKGAEETPPVETSASGTAKFNIGEDKSVTGGVMTKGIEGTMAHIHLGASGASGPPIITLTKGANGTWSVPAGSKLTDEQYSSFKTGNLYVNVHSAEHKPGEIRGQLKP
jgi:hypothetical protein